MANVGRPQHDNDHCLAEAIRSEPFTKSGEIHRATFAGTWLIFVNETAQVVNRKWTRCLFACWKSLTALCLLMILGTRSLNGSTLLVPVSYVAG